MPAQSSPPPCGSRDSSTRVSVSAIAAMPIGRLTKKIASQPMRLDEHAADQRPDGHGRADRRAPDADRGAAVAPW